MKYILFIIVSKHREQGKQDKVIKIKVKISNINKCKNFKM